MKNYPEYKKRFENFSNQKFQIRARIGTRKWVVEVVSSQVVLSDMVVGERKIGGWPMRGLETNHVISGKMKGLKKCMGTT